MFDAMKTSSQLKTWALVLFMVLGGGAFLTGCDQGPAEEAGEEIDDAVDDAGDAIEDAAD